MHMETITVVEVNKDVVQRKVKRMYTLVAQKPKGLKLHFEIGRKLCRELGYPIKDLNKIPKEAIDSFAGVGYHFDFANLKEGDKVLDLGSGSGTDLFIASVKVGKRGKAVGLDMTNAQLDKVKKLINKNGFTNIELRKGYIEELPFDEQTFDIVISNGVINLSPEKSKVFKEIARILKEDGRMAISDIISEKQLPQGIVCDPTLWAECIGGAMQQDDYKNSILLSGLKIKDIRGNPQYRFLSTGAAKATEKYGVKSVSILAVKI